MKEIDFAGMETEHYYNTKTDEILLIFDRMVNREMDSELIGDIRKGFDEEYSITRSE